MSQENLGKLIVLLEDRLNSTGKTPSTDKYGNIVYVDCSIYDKSKLESFISF